MSESNPEQRPPRRRRYSGKHPRNFADKYKEHQPDRFPADVAKVLASGKTPAGTHRPIMVDEVLAGLRPKPGETAVDCTLGYGGHATAILKAIQPGGRLLAIDSDPIELTKTEARLRELPFPAESLVIRRLNFAGIARVVAEVFPAGVDMILADLGVSSMQLDDPERGFTFKSDGPLDMRMNPARGMPASAMLAKLDAAEFADLLNEYADEPYAGDLAAGLLKRQARKPLETTQSLCDAIRAVYPHQDEERIGEAIRRVFQTLRIAVNDELNALDSLLRSLPGCLKPGGRVAILSFHSGEDRRVKQAFRQGLQAGIYGEISAEVIRATFEEQRANPRSIPAKLRNAVRK